MNKGRMKSIEAPRTANRKRGFTIVELLIAVAVIMILAAMAVFQFRSTLQAADSDAAMRELVTQIRQAREYAISNHRYIQVKFPVSAAGLPQIQITQRNDLTTAFGVETAGANVVMPAVTLESPLVYTLVAGMPDTPDGFGKASAIEFEGDAGGPLWECYFKATANLSTRELICRSTGPFFSES